MKLAALLPRTLQTLTALWATAVRMKSLAPVALLAPVLVSSIIAEPCAAQRTANVSGKGPIDPYVPPLPPAPKVWTGVGEAHHGLYLYRVKFEVKLYQKNIAGGQVESNCYVSVTSFQRKVLGNWKDISTGSSGVTLSGNFNPTRVPSNLYLSNPIGTKTLSGLSTVQHFKDVGAPGFAMTHGSYNIIAYTPSNKPVSASISW